MSVDYSQKRLFLSHEKNLQHSKRIRQGLNRLFFSCCQENHFVNLMLKSLIISTKTFGFMLEAYFHSIKSGNSFKGNNSPKSTLEILEIFESFITYISLLFIIGEQAKVHVDFPEKINTWAINLTTNPLSVRLFN